MPVDAEPPSGGVPRDAARGASGRLVAFSARAVAVAVAVAVVVAAGCGGAGERPAVGRDEGERPARPDADAGAATGGHAAVAQALMDAGGSDAVAASAARPAPPGWTDVAALLPDAVLDLRYATDRNLTGAPLYPVARCLLREPVARRLADAARRLTARGHRLVLWDCYRPASLQAELWRRVPDARFVAPPRFDDAGRPLAGSRHSRGAAVDVSLAAPDGALRAMPTDHDAFGPAASGGGARGDAARHLADLRAAMTGAGFTPLASEWWHFDAPDPLAFPLTDEPLDGR